MCVHAFHEIHPWFLTLHAPNNSQHSSQATVDLDILIETFNVSVICVEFQTSAVSWDELGGYILQIQNNVTHAQICFMNHLVNHLVTELLTQFVVVVNKVEPKTNGDVKYRTEQILTQDFL